jgi:hypothetical protein
MVVTQGNWASIVQRDLSEVFLNQHRNFKSMLPNLYKMVDATQGTEYDLEAGDIGEVPEFSGSISFDDFKEGYKKSITETEYALGIKVQRKLLRNDLYEVVRNQAGLLASAFRQKKEQIGASPFNNAFTTVHTVGDGLSLCNSAHTSKVGGSTQGNSGSSALSAANLEATRLNMVKFKTNRDNIRVAQPSLILVPSDLHQTAWEIINSYGKVDTANNNRNFHFGKYNLAVWDNFLTDTNNWFLIDEELMKMVLKFRVWEPVQFFRAGEFDTLVQKFAGYMSNGVSTFEWRWIYGHNVS